MNNIRTIEFAGTRLTFLPGAVFLLCALLWNPTLYSHPGGGWDLQVFTAGALGLIAGGLLLCAFTRTMQTFVRLKPWAKAALGGFFLLVLGHFLLHYPRWTIAQFGEGMIWIAVPALVCAQERFFRKALIPFLAFLGAFDLLCCGVRILRGSPLWGIGIAGNVNWNAAVLALTAPFLLAWFCQWYAKRKNRLILIGGCAVTLACLVAFLAIGSKGAICGAAVTALVYAWLKAAPKWRRIMAATVLLLLLGGAFWITRNTGRISRFIMDDGRVLLYEGAWSMIVERPVFGVGQGSFETGFMTHRPGDYFFILNPAWRSNHPHNHLLFIAASWGLAGLLLWGALLFAPLGMAAWKLYKREPLSPLTTLSFSVLLYAVLHGMVDLILVSWPTNLIALMCLGLLWDEFLLTDRTAGKKWLIPAGVSGVLARVVGVLLLAGGGLAAWRSAYAVLQVRELYRGNLPAAAQKRLIRRTVRWCPAEYPAGLAMLRYLETRLNDPELSVAVADAMLRANIPNYPWLHLMRGNALMKLRRFSEAFADYRTEAELFPFTLRPVHNMILAARAVNAGKLAAQCGEELRRRMRIREVDEATLPKILRDAHYDLRLRETPE